MEGLKVDSTRSRLSALWIFATLNYLYCDVVTLMDPDMLRKFLSGSIGTVTVTQGFLLGAAALVEIPMAMALLSRLLGYRSNRLANVIAGVAMTLVQALSLVVKTPAPYYAFFSAIEITTTLAVVWVAWRWIRATAGQRLTVGAPAHRRSGATYGLQVITLLRRGGGLSNGPNCRRHAPGGLLVQGAPVHCHLDR